MTGALRTADILLNLPRPIHWISRDHPRTESANAVSFADWGEQGRCASDARWCRNAPARRELRNGSNKSEREPTSGRSTNYESEHLIRVFRDIGRIFSFAVPPQPPVARWSFAERQRVQKRKTKYGFVEGENGFSCVSCGTHLLGTSRLGVIRQNENPATLNRGGVSEPSRI